MSKLKDTLLMMAVEKETFKIGDKTFQIIEVVEAEQPQPDYSHLVGKFVRCWKDSLDGHVNEKWYPVNDVQGDIITIDNNRNHSVKWNINLGAVQEHFDLLNPSETNPDEVKKILVPSEVEIKKYDKVFGIEFGKRQFLFSRFDDEIPYSVLSSFNFTPIQCELIKCERAELKKGDVAFRSDSENFDFTDLSHYCVIIDESTHCFIHENTNALIGDKSRNHWYKLQPIEQ